MQINQTTLTAYNKYNGGNQGTLIGNWYEERVIRDVTGVGRTLPGEHMKKTRADLFNKPPEEVPFMQNPRKEDNTNERTLGKKTNNWPGTEGHVYGTGKNKADSLRKQGDKSVKREGFFMEQIQQELAEIKQQDDDDANRREFNTTSKDEFYQKDPIEVGNVLGKRVMKTQNGEPIPFAQKDADFLVDQGYADRQQYLTDDQLKKFLPRGESYLTQQPITFWSEKSNEEVVYMSKNNSQQPSQTFKMNNDFLKTYQHYSHIKK